MENDQELKTQHSLPLEEENQDHQSIRETMDRLKAAWHHKGFVLLTTVVVFLGAFFWVSTQTPIYKATATLLFNPKGAVDQETKDLSNLSMQAELMKSPVYANEVIKKFNLLSVESFARAYNPASLLIMNMAININEDSRTMNIGYFSPNPELAAFVANAIAETFIYAGTEKRSESTEADIQTMREEIEKYGKEADEIKQKIREYVENHPELEDETLLSRQLAQLNESLASINSRRVENLTLLTEMKRYLKEGGRIDSHPIIRSNQKIAGKLDELREAEINLMELEQQYRSKHPKIVTANLEIEALKRSVDFEAQKALEDIEHESKALNAHEKATEAEIAEIQKRVQGTAPERAYLSKLRAQEKTKMELIEALNARISQVAITGSLRRAGVEILTRAEQPGKPVKPNKQKILLQALLGGLLLGIGAVIAREYLDNSIRSSDQLETVVGEVPLFGQIPRVTIKDNKIRFFNESKEILFHESMNFIQTNINFAFAGTDKKVLMLTSAEKEEGKTFSLYSLAKIFAESDKKVVIVDVDFRRSGMNKFFPSENVERKSLDSFLMEEVGYTDVIEKTEFENIDYVRSGRAKFNTPEALKSVHMKDFIAELRKHYDLVLIDTPPISYVDDALTLVDSVDAVILVIRKAKTDRFIVRKAVRKLLSVNSGISGVIFSQAKDHKRDLYYY